MIARAPLKNQTRRILSGMLAFSLSLGFLLSTGCSTPDGAHGGLPPAKRVFRMNISTEPPDLDPMKVTDLTSYNVESAIMRGLTRFGPKGEVQPAVAQSWDVSSDGLRYTFHLRKDAKWSDGKPVTARDFLYAWQRALSPGNAADYAFFLFELKNGKAFYEKKIKDFSQVGVQAPDDHTLVVRLERPVAFFLGLTASPISFPLRKDMIDRHGDRFTEPGNFITNGPYLMESWTHEDRITLKPNPLYYGPKPKVDRVEMLMVNDANTSVVMYENDELDYIETPSSIPAFDVRRLSKRPEYRSGVIHAIYYVGFNTQKPPFDKLKVRQAFAAALDRNYYPKLLQSGQKPIASWISPGLSGYNPTLGIQYDPAKAKRLLAEAGYPDGKGFPKVELAFRSMYDIQKEAEIAQFLWRKNLNVDVRLRNMDWKVYLSQLKQDTPHLYRLNWYVDYPDADSFMTLFTADNGNNYTHWKSADYDQWVARAAVTLDPRQRQALYDRAQRLLLEERAVIIPIYVGEKGYLVKPAVRGLAVNALNIIDMDNLSVTPR